MMISKEMIAEEAEVIIGGYAINRCDGGLRIVNLNNGGHLAIVREDGTLIETNMDDIELAIATEYAMQALNYMETGNYA